MSFFEKLKKSVEQRFEATPSNMDAAKEGAFVFQVEEAMKARHKVTVLIGKLLQGTLEIGKPFKVTFIDGTTESFPIWDIVFSNGNCRSIAAIDSRFPIPLGIAFAPEYHDRLLIDRILKMKTRE